MDEAVRVDLHAHTTASDGGLSPEALWGAMCAAGLRVAAITDHDTFAGLRSLATSGAVTDGSAGPLLVPGLEINAAPSDRLPGEGTGRAPGEIHLLGLGVRIDAPGMDAVLARQRALRRERILAMLERLRAAVPALPLTAEEVEAVPDAHAVGRPLLARALVQAGAATSIDDAFARFLAPGGPAWVPRRGIDALEAVERIREAGGLAVLAHPFGLADDPSALDPLVEAGLAGIEAHYRSFPDAVVTALLALAADRGLLVTGGSDFHGADPAVYREAVAGARIPAAVGERLLAALAA